MPFLVALAAMAFAADHPCVGDYVFRAAGDEVSIGVRIRNDPDVAEVLFSDYGNIRPSHVNWNVDSLTIVDSHDQSNVVLVCDTDTPKLILPASEYTSARIFKLTKTQGSLWDVGKREGWLTPDD